MNYTDLPEEKKTLVDESVIKLQKFVTEEATFINVLFTDEYGVDWEKIPPEQLVKICFSKLSESIKGKLCPYMDKDCALDNCLCFNHDVRNCATDGSLSSLSFMCSKGCFDRYFNIPSDFQRRCMEYSRMTPEQMVDKFVEAYAFPKDADALVRSILNSCEYAETEKSISYGNIRAAKSRRNQGIVGGSMVAQSLLR